MSKNEQIKTLTKALEEIRDNRYKTYVTQRVVTDEGKEVSVTFTEYVGDKEVARLALEDVRS